MTIQEIKTHMINFLSKVIINNNNVLYDSDGYCGHKLLFQIKEFWNNISTDKDILSVISGRWEDDGLDLHGGRSYLLTSSSVIPMIFDYLYNNMGYTKSTFERCIYDASEISDMILDMYDETPVIRDEKINTILSKNNDSLKDECKFIILKYPKEMKDELDKNPNLTFIDYSKVDKCSPIYRVDIPSGFEIVPSLKESI